MTKPSILREQPDFSLVLGGPLYQLFRRARLSGDEMELLVRRTLVISCVAWLPLLVLSAIEGRALGDAIEIPFLHDIEVHVRFLVALPILIGAERIVHLRIRPVVGAFVERRIVAPDDMPRFHQAIESASRVRNSLAAEVTLLVLVFTVGLWIGRSQIAPGMAGWYALPDGAEMRLTAAGYWCFLVSLPIFQFILLRWYLRFLIWCWFLWRVSKLDLRLVPNHPDRTAGLAFLNKSLTAFMPILLAQGCLLAGLIASRIFHAGQNLMSFRLQAPAFMAVFIVATLIPLAVFAPQLASAKQRGLREFSQLAGRYARAFEDKWLRRDAPSDDELLGSGDIQSLTDLGGSYEVVREMRAVPFGMGDVIPLAVATALPLLPLTLTMFSPEEVLAHVLKVLF